MTDNEIISALKICTSEDLGCEDDCPFLEFCKQDIDSLEKAALDLINRQKAEIERLSNFVSEERCREIAKEMFPPVVAKAKSEAYREFADRLCEDRVSNDPVVIAVKTELKFMEE